MNFKDKAQLVLAVLGMIAMVVGIYILFYRYLELIR